jgi:UDP-N-acetylglucosamine 1-carboxyvinyltransferase
MERFVIHGGSPLQGTVQVHGAKNAVLPMMAAALLTREPVILRDVPRLVDIETMARILQELGCRIDWVGTTMRLQVVDEAPYTARRELVKTMRGSFCVLGPLLGRRRRAKVSYPGGCVIGVRPIDLHLKGLKALGAEIDVREGNVAATADRLRGSAMFLGGAFGSTVTGTMNVLMASVLARGRTVIDFAACEPEVQELCRMLGAMGARISGVGSPRLEIEGVDELRGCEIDVIPDRIEAGTFLVAAAVTRGDVFVENARAEHLGAVIETLRQCGAEIICSPTSIHVQAPAGLRAADITTLPYPGFPTDLQAQFMAMCSVAEGISVIQERIYPDRFMHVAELGRLGARIRKDGSAAVVIGTDRLHGAPVMASDLRAGAALVTAGLAAEGVTEVERIYHIDRGYDRLEERLRGLGARIERAAMADSKVVGEAA